METMKRGIDYTTEPQATEPKDTTEPQATETTEPPLPQATELH
jgi:hypothetical protein